MLSLGTPSVSPASQKLSKRAILRSASAIPVSQPPSVKFSCQLYAFPFQKTHWARSRRARWPQLVRETIIAASARVQLFVFAFDRSLRRSS